MALSSGRMPVAAVLASLVAVTAAGCANAGHLVLDGSVPEHGRSSACLATSSGARALVFGIGLANEGGAAVTITGLDAVAANTVKIEEFSVADPGSDGSGWGTVHPDDIPPELAAAWESRSDPMGVEVEPGETTWVLMVVRNLGTPEQRTGVRGVRVEFDGAPWVRATENQDVYGFGPDGEDCDAGMGSLEE